MASRSAVIAWISTVVVCHSIAGCFSLEFTAEPADTVVTPGGEVLLECLTSETSVTVTWYKIDGTLITPSSNENYTQLPDGSLRITSFTDVDSGKYYCVVENSEGSVRSREAQLQLAYLGEESVLFEVKTVDEYSSLVLRCNVPESIPPANTSWSKEGLKVELDNEIGVTLSHELVFSCIRENYQAPWTCLVSNQFYQSDEIGTSFYVLMVSTGSSSPFQLIELLPDALPISQSVLVGDTVQFQCFAVGCPAPTFSWSKDGSPVSALDRIFLSQKSRILTIKDVELGDAGNYTCLATQASSTVTHLYASAMLTVQEPLTVTSSFPATSALASMSANFTCMAVGPGTIFWIWRYNAMDLYPSDDVYFNSNGTVSTMIMDNLSVDEGGFIQCVAYDGQGNYSSAHELLTVTTMPLEFTHGDECGDILAVNGTNIVLPCTAIAYPPPSFSWKKTNQLLDVGSIPRLSLSELMFNGTLTISPSVLNDNGVYVCTAQNELDSLDSKARIVTVIVEPQIVAKPMDAIVVEESNTSLNCGIAANSQAIIHYSWSRDGTVYLENQESGVLSISGVQQEDFGKYECAATIWALGTCAPPIVVMVGTAFLSAVEPTAPSPPLDLRAINITTKSAHISWSEPENTGGIKIISYEIMVVSLGRSHCQLGTNSLNYSMVPSAEPLQTITIPYLIPYFQYQVVVAATNSKSTSNFSEPLVFWTGQEAPSGAPGEVSSIQGDKAGEVYIFWKAPPCNETNGVITNYSVEYSIPSRPDLQLDNLLTSTNVTTLTVELQPFVDYVVQVSAHTSKGAGPQSLAVTIQSIIADRPGPPTAVMAEAINSTTVHLEWQPPDPLPQPPHNLTAISQYLVRGVSGDVHVPQDTLSLDYTGLAGGTEQTLSVAAINSFGVGDPQTVMVVLPSPSVEAIYQEVWFLAVSSGVALLLIAMILVIIITVCRCVTKERKRKGTGITNIRRQSSFSSDLTNGSLRRGTVLDHMMTVEEVDSHCDPSDYQELDQARQEMQDASSISTLQSRSSSLQPNSRYRYRSPLEQEIYASQRIVVSSEVVENNSLRNSQSESMRRWAPSSLRPMWRKANTFIPPSMTQRLYVKPPSRNSSSPTDTVDSFEYQSQEQVVAEMERSPRKQHFRHSGRNGLRQPHSNIYDHLPKGHNVPRRQGSEKTSSPHPPTGLSHVMQASSTTHPDMVHLPSEHKPYRGMQGWFKAGSQSPPHAPNAMPADTHHAPSPQNSGTSSPLRTMSPLSSTRSSQSSSHKRKYRDLAILTALTGSEKTSVSPQPPVPVMNPVPPLDHPAPMPLEHGATRVLQFSHLPNEDDISEPLHTHCLESIHRQPTKLAEEEEKKEIIRRLQQKQRNNGCSPPALNMFPFSSGAELPLPAGIPGKYAQTESTFV